MNLALAIQVALIVAGVPLVVAALRWRGRGSTSTSWSTLFAVSIGACGVLEMIQASRISRMDVLFWAGIVAGALFLAAALMMISPRRRASVQEH
jgi:hypothetical protein